MPSKSIRFNDKKHEDILKELAQVPSGDQSRWIIEMIRAGMQAKIKIKIAPVPKIDESIVSAIMETVGTRERQEPILRQRMPSEILAEKKRLAAEKFKR